MSNIGTTPALMLNRSSLVATITAPISRRKVTFHNLILQCMGLVVALFSRADCPASCPLSEVLLPHRPCCRRGS
jgi:hypothetical protein